MPDSPLGVLLTAGLGTRLAPLTPDIPKPLVPLLNRPLVAYGLDLLASMGVREVVVVVSKGDQRIGPVAVASAPPGVTVTVEEQLEPRGSGDALASAGSALDGRHVAVLAVDTVLRGGDLHEQMQAFATSGATAWLPLHVTDRPRQMGIAELDGDRVVTLEEKPQEPRSNLACVGLWLLAPDAVERIRHNPIINAKGESDLTATVAAMLDEGAHVGGRGFEGDWLDGGAIIGLVEAQTALLKDLDAPAFTGTGCTVDGVIAVDPSAQVTASKLTGPVLIGANAHVEDCELGPNVVVGDGAQLHGVRLRNALVAHGAHIEGGEYTDVVITSTGAIAGAV